MTDYCHVTDGVVDEGPRSLPTSWKNVSGLDRGSPGTLKALGWLPVTYVNADYDPDTQVRSGPILNVSNNSVTATFNVRDKTPSELDDEKEAKSGAILSEASFKALIDVLNDGSFVPGSNYTDREIQDILKGKVRVR